MGKDVEPVWPWITSPILSENRISPQRRQTPPDPPEFLHAEMWNFPRPEQNELLPLVLLQQVRVLLWPQGPALLVGQDTWVPDTQGSPLPAPP